MSAYRKINGEMIPVTTEGHPQYYFQTKAQAEAALSTLEVGADVFVEEGGNEDVLPRVRELEEDVSEINSNLSDISKVVNHDLINANVSDITLGGVHHVAHISGKYYLVAFTITISLNSGRGAGLPLFGFKVNNKWLRLWSPYRIIGEGTAKPYISTMYSGNPYVCINNNQDLTSGYTDVLNYCGIAELID